MTNKSNIEDKEVITFDEFRAWLAGLIRGKRGALPDLEDWKMIKMMIDKVEVEKEVVNVPQPYPVPNPIEPPYRPEPFQPYPQPRWIPAPDTGDPLYEMPFVWCTTELTDKTETRVSVGDGNTTVQLNQASNNLAGSLGEAIDAMIAANQTY